jgi:hypothetical protein
MTRSRSTATAARLMDIEPAAPVVPAAADRFLGNMGDDVIRAARREHRDRSAQQYALIESMRQSAATHGRTMTRGDGAMQVHTARRPLTVNGLRAAAINVVRSVLITSTVVSFFVLWFFNPQAGRFLFAIPPLLVLASLPRVRASIIPWALYVIGFLVFIDLPHDLCGGAFSCSLRLRHRPGARAVLRTLAYSPSSEPLV